MTDIQFEPSLVELMLFPTRYDGCPIVVWGYVDTANGSTRLYATPDDRKLGGRLVGEIRVTLRRLKVKEGVDSLENSSGTVVRVEGIFKAPVSGGRAHPELEAERISSG